MRPYLSSLTCSGLFVLGALYGFSSPAMADAAGTISDIAPTVDAAGEAFRTLPDQPVIRDDWKASCGIGVSCTNGQAGFQSGVLIRRQSANRSAASDGNIQLARGGGGGGFHGGGGFMIRGGGGGFHGIGGGSWRGGWRGGGWHGMGAWRGAGWRGGVWRGNTWRGNVWRGGGWHGMGAWNGGVWRGGWHGIRGNRFVNRRFFGNGGGDFLDWGWGWYGIGLPYYPYSDDFYGVGYNQYGITPYVASSAHVNWCFNRYRSYRAWDNTFQPNFGPRRQCVSPF